jgi:DNA-directed RNA polymerase subunit RPC12/RpoP
MRIYYPGSETRITDALPLYRCRCGYETWALTTDRRITCRKCGAEMERTKEKQEPCNVPVL